MKAVDTKFKDREEAGRILADRLTKYANQKPIVLGLPRGGVPVAFEVAKALKAQLDVFVVRKLGTPGQEELAMGAVASGGVRVLNTPVIEALGISEDEIETETRKERAEAERRGRLYRGNRSRLNVEERTIILVDDGVATGSTIKAGIAALKQLKVGRIVVAVPVAPTSTIEELKMEADEVVCVSTPEPFFAIGLWYEEFPQTTDEEVRDLLKKAEMKKEAMAGA